MGQALMAARCQQEEADERCNEALTALMRAIELTPAEVNNEAHAQYLKGVCIYVVVVCTIH
jgi:hypothetical protein